MSRRLLASSALSLAVAVAVLAGPGTALAATGGAFDPSFSKDGWQLARYQHTVDFADAVARQSDGKILAGGGVEVPDGGDFGLVRLTIDGRIDSTFGDHGWAIANFGGQDLLAALAVQPTGEIVAAGYTFQGGHYDFAVARFTSTGQLDPTFGGGDGMVTTDFGHGDDFGDGVTLDGTNIVVSGAAQSATGDNDFALAMYDASGAPVASFGTGGKVTTDVSGSHANDSAPAVTVQNGNIVAAGYANVGGGGYDFAAAEYDSTGSLVPTFGGGDGIVTTDFGHGNDIGSSVALDGNDIVVGGTASNGTNDDFAAAVYTPLGTLDPTIGGGMLTSDVGGKDDEGYGVGVDSQSRIVLAGKSLFGHKSHIGLARFTSNGSPDATFGNGGKEAVTLGRRATAAFGVTIQPDDKIVTAGYARASFAIARFLP
jgi:uncharacterized delta-60 repeat protein